MSTHSVLILYLSEPLPPGKTLNSSINSDNDPLHKIRHRLEVPEAALVASLKSKTYSLTDKSLSLVRVRTCLHWV
jgi:hypothetical protein